MTGPALKNGHLVVFVATERGGVPPGIDRYISVDGAVPGASLTWDHHATGELINLDTMPQEFDAQGFDGVGTTLPDTDAVASVVALLLGGVARLPSTARDILVAASHHCDYLRPAPEVTTALNRSGRNLHRYLSRRFAGASQADLGVIFAGLCRELASRLLAGEPLPEEEGGELEERRAADLVARGLLTHHGHVAVLDLRGEAGRVEPATIYAHVRGPVSVFVENHPRGGLRYTVGRNPGHPDAPGDLRPALRALARREHEHGPPALAPEPVAGAENWGGRATVFGSPWNYGSRLSIHEVVATLEAAL